MRAFNRHDLYMSLTAIIESDKDRYDQEAKISFSIGDKCSNLICRW